MKIFFILSFFALLSACSNPASTSSRQGLIAPDELKAIVGGREVQSNESLANRVFLYRGIKDVTVQKTATGDITVTNSYICTTSALSARIVILAAHCVKDAAQVRRVEVKNELGKLQLIHVKKVVIHPDYSTEGDSADLAILLLDSDLPKNIEVMKLATVNDVLDLTSVIAAGYGKTTGVNREAAEGTAGILRTTTLNVTTFDTEKPDIIVDQTQGVGLCQGDSGGPAMTTLQGQPAIIGIASRVLFPGSADTTDKSFDSCQFQGIYVNVPYYYYWILDTMRGL